MATSNSSWKTATTVATAAIAGAAAGALATLALLRRRTVSDGGAGSDVASFSTQQPSLPTCRAQWLITKPGLQPRIVLIATGSVATVKVPELVILLSEIAEVTVVLSSSGAHMVSNVAGQYNATAFAAFRQLHDTGVVRIVQDSDEWRGYENVSGDSVVHVELRKWADLVVIAPCSANTISKVANGLCDNLATCLMRAWSPDKPAVIAPAMNTVMWEHPMTSQHLTTLESWGYQIVKPASKRLACGDVGRGALAPLDEVMDAVRRAIQGHIERRGCDAPGAWQRRGFAEWRSAM